MKISFPFRPMLVINVTPDSFSDGGKFLSPESFVQQWHAALGEQTFMQNSGVIDIGVQSTSPTSMPITATQEEQRWQTFFHQTFSLMAHTFNQQNHHPILSFDTYRATTMKYILSQLPSSHVWWNDVSGCYAQEVLPLLAEFQDLKYVCCHNHVTTREETPQHAKFSNATLSQSEWQHQFIDFFGIATNYFSSHKVADRVLLDPSFGFAKTREQNFWLLELLPDLLQKFASFDFVIGMSRKAFLREPGQSYHDPGQAKQAEWLQSYILGHLSGMIARQRGQQKIYLRLHDLDYFRYGLKNFSNET